MKTITNVRKLWNNGVESPYPALRLEDIDELKRRTGAVNVVAIRWTYCGEEHQTPHQVRVFPDRTGLVHCEGGGPAGKRLIVLNGDGTQRVTIAVPRVDANSRPKEGYLSLPPSSAGFGGIEWGSEGNDGYTDYLFDFDWNTGKLMRYARPSRPW
jgi:hypothetical protein